MDSDGQIAAVVIFLVLFIVVALSCAMYLSNACRGNRDIVVCLDEACKKTNAGVCKDGRAYVLSTWEEK